MSKKIVVITGSPRKKGNSFAMTEAFVKAAEKKGHTVTRFDIADECRRMSCLRNLLQNRKSLLL